MAHNIFVLLQLLEYDRQESGMNIYNALKIKAQSVLDGHSYQISPIFVFMRTNTFHQEACHFEMGISE